MGKYIMDLTVRSAERPGQDYVLLKMGAEGALPPIQPGQFAELKVEHSPTTFLRRPISVNFVDEEKKPISKKSIGGKKDTVVLNKKNVVNKNIPEKKKFC